MCGPITVPFAAVAAWSTATSAKLLWASLAVIAFLVASYRVWRSQRIHSDSEIERRQAEIQELRRKPYTEELGRQAEALLNLLSPDGQQLVRHLLEREPIEQGRRFRPDITQDTQDLQLSIAYGTGIIRYSETRHPSHGAVIRTDYVINPQFREVLQDMLYE
jgi:hypothetical protein